jgi:hypothetical protein
MMYDVRGAMRQKKFDPDAGTFIAAAKKLGFDEHFYGLGEKAARLDKRRGAFVNWNSDTPGYVEGRDPIYQTVPFYIGLQDGAAYGIFFDNSYRSYFDFGQFSQERIWFGAEGGEMNYYFLYGSSIKKILGRYVDLTGDTCHCLRFGRSATNKAVTATIRTRRWKRWCGIIAKMLLSDAHIIDLPPISSSIESHLSRPDGDDQLLLGLPHLNFAECW